MLCKKCEITEIPEGARYKVCAQCRKKRIENLKKAGALVGSAFCLVVAVATAGKVNLRK